MKKWKCTICGYIHTGEEPPEKCPVCGADSSKFEEVIEETVDVADAAEIAEQAPAQPSDPGIEPEALGCTDE